MFALGLASIKLAEAFNNLATTSFASRGVGVLLGLLVLLVGHSINFAMGIMSGVVHGLRLNLIEFFNWSLPEEGEVFRAFEKKAMKSGRIRRQSPSAERAELLIPAELVSLEDLRRKPEEAKPGTLTHFGLSLGGGMLREGLSFGVSDGLQAGFESSWWMRTCRST